jgi:calcium-dependent protein kinase
LLTPNYKKRITASEALEDEWFKKHKKIEVGSEEDKLDPELGLKLKEFRGTSALKKAAMNVLVKMLNEKEIEHLREQFHQIDKNRTGLIDASELSEAIKKMDFDIPEEEINHIIKEIDYAGNGMVNYSEFLAATISVKSILTHEKIWALFAQFDTDNTGSITKSNIKEAFSKLGKKISEEELKTIMKEHDIKKDGKISFEEFKAMMTE